MKLKTKTTNLKQMKIEFTREELEILLACIHELNWSGKQVRSVGLLADKLMKMIDLITTKQKADA